MVTTVATAAMTVMAATGATAATAAPTAAAAVPAPVFYWPVPPRRRGMRSIGARANTYSELPFPHIPRYLSTNLNIKIFQYLSHSQHCKITKENYLHISRLSCVAYFCWQCWKMYQTKPATKSIALFLLYLYYLYKPILIILCLTVNQIYDSLFMKHINFCIHTFKFNFNTHTHTHTKTKTTTK